MVTKFLVGTIAAAALAFSAVSAEAQGDKPVTFGVAAGVSLPTGDFSDFYKAGYNAALSASFKSPYSPVSFRVEAGYDAFGGEGTLEDFKVFNGSANVVFNVPSASGVKPYLIAGAGAYVWDAGASNETDLGFNGGLGINMDLSGFQTFLEARYHFINTDNAGINPKFIPITFGIRF